jgi:hypothetical protein
MMDMLELSSQGGTGSPPKGSATLNHRSPKQTPPLLSPDEREEDDEPVLPPRGRTTLEPDDKGVTNLINDFSGIIRLGDAPQGGTTVEGSSTALPPVTPNPLSPHSARTPARMGQASIGGLLRKGVQPSSASMRAQTRDSVRNFINEQAHTEHVADPNAAAPSPGPDQADVSSIGSGLPSSSESASASSGGGSNLFTPQPISANRWAQFNDASSDNASGKPGDSSSPDMYSDEGVPAEESYTTSRFQHLETEEGHHVITGREGTMQRCEEEPITIPGAVQGFGVLILLEEDYDTGDMTVRQVSEVSHFHTTPDIRIRPSSLACHPSTSSACSASPTSSPTIRRMCCATTSSPYRTRMTSCPSTLASTRALRCSALLGMASQGATTPGTRRHRGRCRPTAAASGHAGSLRAAPRWTLGSNTTSTASRSRSLISSSSSLS